MDDQQDWKLDSAFRQTIVDKIGLAMTVTKVSLKPQHKKDPVDIERTFCEKAQSRQNYLMLVQRLLDVLSGKNKDSKLTNANNQGETINMMPQHPVPQQQLQPGQQQQRMVQPNQQQMMQMQPQGAQMAMMRGQGNVGMSQLQQRLTGNMQGQQQQMMMNQQRMMQSRQMMQQPRGPPPMYVSHMSPMMPQQQQQQQAQQQPQQQGQYMAPSPMTPPQMRHPSPSNLSTPQMNQEAQMHPNPEEQAYLDKVKQLSRYIEPLRRMIARIGNSDNDKLIKMNKLLDILSNPSKRMPMETLIKCEAVLNKMDLDSDSGSSNQSAQSEPLIEAINKMKQEGHNMNDVLQRTFKGPCDVLFGVDIAPPVWKKPKVESEDEDDSEDGIPYVLQIELKRIQKQFKVTHEAQQDEVKLVCKLEDDNLPSVPPLEVTILKDYPDSSPICDVDHLTEVYFATEFLRRVQDALSARLSKMASRFTLSQLLGAWEMSIRAACSPNYHRLAADKNNTTDNVVLKQLTA